MTKRLILALLALLVFLVLLVSLVQQPPSADYRRAGEKSLISENEGKMLKSIRNLDYVVLICRDLSRMRGFYHGVLGFPIHLETDSWIEMSVGGALLTLSNRERPYVGPPPPEGSASVQLAFRVSPEEIQGCYEELKARGVEIVQAPQLIDRSAWKYWQHETLFFKDPEGNLLEIYAEIELPQEP